MVIDAGPKNKANEATLRSERRSAPNKCLTEPTLLEMSGNAGGLNGSTQHKARTHLPLKTKAKIAR